MWEEEALSLSLGPANITSSAKALALAELVMFAGPNDKLSASSSHIQDQEPATIKLWICGYTAEDEFGLLLAGYDFNLHVRRFLDCFEQSGAVHSIARRAGGKHPN